MTQKLLSKIKEIDALENEKFSQGEKRNVEDIKKNKVIPSIKKIKCYTCNQEGHGSWECLKKNKKLNEIPETVELLNKSNYAYINSYKYKVLLDTGATDSYKTWPMVSKCNRAANRLENPIQRYTCLGEPFQIKQECLIEFEYEMKKFKEKVLVLPSRRDNKILILGWNWIQNRTHTECTGEKRKPKDFKEAPFSRKKNGLTSDYECVINILGYEVISEGNTHIPRALERKVDIAIEELVMKGYI
jgi:hypothetical protein